MDRKVQVYKSSNTRYHRAPWIVRWRTPDGKRHFTSFTAKGRAVQFARRTGEQINSEQFRSFTPLAWQTLTDRFLESKKADRVSPATLKIYMEVFAEFAAVCHNPPSNRITPARIDRYKAHLTGNKTTTINKKLRHLTALFHWAIKRKHMQENPIESKLREDKRHPHSLTPDEFAKILDACTDSQWKVLIHLAINGCARKNSLTTITLDDINFEHNTVAVFDTKQKEHRICPIHPESMKVLTAYVAELPDGQTKLFTGKFHNQTWERITKAAAVRHIQFHHLRTCCSSWLKARGVPDAIVSRILGHAVQGVTEKYYTDLDDIEIKRDAILKLPIPPADPQSNSLAPVRDNG